MKVLKNLLLALAIISVIALSACGPKNESAPAAPQAEVTFEDPNIVAPTAEELDQYSIVPTVTPIFTVGQFQPSYLEQSVPTMQITPPVDSAYSFCGREGKDIVFAETSGNKRIEITYIGQFYEIPPVLTGSYKQVSTTGNFGEQIIGVIAPNNAIELPNGTFTNWQVVAVYCMAPYQTQALEYIQGGIYRVMANNVYAYYQAIGYSVSYIDNETGRGLDSKPPTSDQMVPWPVPGVTIVP